MSTKAKKILAITALTMLLGTVFIIGTQAFWSHREGFFKPNYKQINLLPMLSKSVLQTDDYYQIFRQTGLGKTAVDTLLEKGTIGKDEIVQYQKAFFAPRTVKCNPMLGWFTREDLVTDNQGQTVLGPTFAVVQPGDIVVTLSTHSLGWNHGHAGIVIDDKRTLESRVLGENSAFVDLNLWRSYANFIVLRVKGISEQLAKSVAEFAKRYLADVPYRLLAGLLGEKEMALNSASFGLQCAYLVWYAWQFFGADLDSDGGKLVTPLDILFSDRVEVVQLYGISPDVFIK